MDENKLTYEDFEIGQIVTLIEELPFDNGTVVGKRYEIEDLDFHFPDSICIKWGSALNRKYGFFKIKYFESESYLREKKIDKLLEDGE